MNPKKILDTVGFYIQRVVRWCGIELKVGRNNENEVIREIVEEAKKKRECYSRNSVLFYCKEGE